MMSGYYIQQIVTHILPNDMHTPKSERVHCRFCDTWKQTNPERMLSDTPAVVSDAFTVMENEPPIFSRYFASLNSHSSILTLTSKHHVSYNNSEDPTTTPSTKYSASALVVIFARVKTISKVHISRQPLIRHFAVCFKTTFFVSFPILFVPWWSKKGFNHLNLLRFRKLHPLNDKWCVFVPEVPPFYHEKSECHYWDVHGT